MRLRNDSIRRSAFAKFPGYIDSRDCTVLGFPYRPQHLPRSCLGRCRPGSRNLFRGSGELRFPSSGSRIRIPSSSPESHPAANLLASPVLAHRLIAVTLSESTSCSSLLLAGNVHRQKRNSSMRPRSDALLFPAPLIIVVSKPAPSDAHAHALALARTSLPSCPTGRLCLSA